MLFDQYSIEQDEARSAITGAYRGAEDAINKVLTQFLDFNGAVEENIYTAAKAYVERVRSKAPEQTGIQKFMVHYDLSTEEGVVLMCLAEALLRVPDSKTQELLIQDKLTSANWNKHIGLSESSFVNVATWGLALSGKLLKTRGSANWFHRTWRNLLKRTGEPILRRAVREAVKLMSQQFVLARYIGEAVDRASELEGHGFTYSFDMLGEASRTQEDADHYFEDYKNAIRELKAHNAHYDFMHKCSISVKLSAIYPRYELHQAERAVPFLIDRLRTLALLAKDCDVSLTVDAEESDRLDISLDIIEAVFSDPRLSEWEGLGFALQAYQKRAFYVLDWAIGLARRHNKRFRIRLVKGAYWDTEIKLAQELGLTDYPVFTHKSATDVSYLACAKKMLQASDAIYPQFATHNAYTVAAILTLVGHCREKPKIEFQQLQGMGVALHELLIEEGQTCRIYAPVGSHEDLLPYLVRRLLENGANSSFVNQLSDPKYEIEALIESPLQKLTRQGGGRNKKIPLPSEIYGKRRVNAQGVDLTDYNALQKLETAFSEVQFTYQALPAGKEGKHLTAVSVTSPANPSDIVGTAYNADETIVAEAVDSAQAAYSGWVRQSLKHRADILLKMADLLEAHHAELLAILSREAGRHLPDAVSELREAVDFCRYYALTGKKVLASKTLEGYTGETDTLSYHGRGVILCISPWNFPLAIFLGQVAAALMAGNTVIAKPAEQTPLIAARVVFLFHKAGVPESVLQLILGKGSVVGPMLLSDERIAGVMFTGSTETAKIIQRSLAERDGPIVPFIAETGGINAMIADSTALPEQLVDDVLISAFGSAGQRCSALRLLCVQEDIADKVIAMLQGAMQLLKVGMPQKLSTDVGPVIDAEAQKMLEDYLSGLDGSVKVLSRTPISETLKGHFFAPTALEIPDIAYLDHEVFGPVLHVLRFKREDLGGLIQSINQKGYGLTFGIQSRIDAVVHEIADQIQAGNIYVNRNMIGAVVGLQPFGGCGLSGTGPKAGGPNYLLRLVHEVTVTINTTAAGGNASLMLLDG